MTKNGEITFHDKNFLILTTVQLKITSLSSLNYLGLSLDFGIVYIKRALWNFQKLAIFTIKLIDQI